MAGQGDARAARRRGFLRALATTGSVCAAARAVGMWPATAYGWRRRDAGFAAAWERALGAARATLSRGAEPALADDEVVRGSTAGRPCVARVGAGRWSAATEARFLETLGATCNVRAACHAAGMSTVAIYNRRKRCPDFARAWDDALDHGWHRLEAGLLFAATSRFEGVDADAIEAAAFAEPMSVDQALTLYKIHRHRVTGEGARPRHDWRRREMPIEAVRAEVLRRVAGLARARERNDGASGTADQVGGDGGSRGEGGSAGA